MEAILQFLYNTPNDTHLHFKYVKLEKREIT